MFYIYFSRQHDNTLWYTTKGRTWRHHCGIHRRILSAGRKYFAAKSSHRHFQVSKTVPKLLLYKISLFLVIFNFLAICDFAFPLPNVKNTDTKHVQFTYDFCICIWKTRVKLCELCWVGVNWLSFGLGSKLFLNEHFTENIYLYVTL